MTGNATFRHRDVAVLSVTAVDAPVVRTSEEFDASIGDSYRRNGLRPGMLAALAGIRERSRLAGWRWSSRASTPRGWVCWSTPR